ncbi:MAG: putative 2OG-Fe(II) oxygenase, partial [Kiloniellales bacterium]
QAIAGYERAIELDPDFTEAHSAYGVLLTELGRPAEAVERFHRALALAPRHVRSHANLGLALAAQGLWEDVDAFFDYDRLVRRHRFDRVPEWDSLDRFNAAVADYIYRRPDLMRDRPSVATKGGSQTENILLDDHPVTRTLESMMRGFYQDYLAAALAGAADPYFDAPPAVWYVKANAVVLTSNGYQDPHIHPVGYCSGVYYVRIPEPVKTAVDSENGYIRFGRAAPGAASDRTRYVTVKPEEGLMLIFPSYFWHGTIPFESDEDRVCVAFDIEPC